MKKYAITVSTCTTVIVEANDSSEAVNIVLNDFENVKSDIMTSIDQNGYEAEYDEDTTNEFNE